MRVRYICKKKVSLQIRLRNPRRLTRDEFFCIKPFPNIPFLLFPQCFLPFWRNVCHFHQFIKVSSANSFGLEQFKICHFGKGLVLFFCMSKDQWTSRFSRIVREMDFMDP